MPTVIEKCRNCPYTTEVDSKTYLCEGCEMESEQKAFRKELEEKFGKEQVEKLITMLEKEPEKLEKLLQM